MRASRVRRRDAGEPTVWVDPGDAAQAAYVGAALLRCVPLPDLGPLFLTIGRTAAGLTQEQLAERAGLSRPQVARMESGDARITASHARAVSGLVGVPFDLLVNAASGRVPA